MSSPHLRGENRRNQRRTEAKHAEPPDRERPDRAPADVRARTNAPEAEDRGNTEADKSRALRGPRSEEHGGARPDNGRMASRLARWLSHETKNRERTRAEATSVPAGPEWVRRTPRLRAWRPHHIAWLMAWRLQAPRIRRGGAVSAMALLDRVRHVAGAIATPHREATSVPAGPEWVRRTPRLRAWRPHHIAWLMAWRLQAPRIRRGGAVSAMALLDRVRHVAGAIATPHREDRRGRIGPEGENRDREQETATQPAKKHGLDEAAIGQKGGSERAAERRKGRPEEAENSKIE